MNTYTTKLLKKRQLTQNVHQLHFEKPADFDFLAGQFVQFMIPDGEKAIPRAYSLSSAPADEELVFCIKYIEDGKASTHFANMTEGETLEMRGPRGNFCLKEPAEAVELIATGTGLAPMLGLVRDELLYKKTTTPIHLLFGVRHESDMFWHEEFQQLAEEFPNFTVDYTLSQPESADWSGLTGRVTAHVIPKQNTHYFLCGSAPMVKDVRGTLLEAGVEKNMMHFEIF